jgi:hypothetical protein
MDPEVRAFRAAAARENRGRRRLQRRYSSALRAQAVYYLGARRQAGDALRDVARGGAMKLVPMDAASTGARAIFPRARRTGSTNRSTIRGDRGCAGRACRRSGRRDGGAARGVIAMSWPGRRVAVYAHAQPTDMRKGFDGLCALVTQGLQRDPLSGDVFLFVSRDRVRAKTLHWDGTRPCAGNRNGAALFGGQRWTHWNICLGESLETTLSTIAMNGSTTSEDRHPRRT